MRIKVLGPGCFNCELLERRVWKALSAARVSATVEKVADLEELDGYWERGMPCLLIDGQLVCAGRVPETGEIAQWIADALDARRNS